MPSHPKAREFFNSGIYTGLASFEELEHRIAAIVENKAKGDAFEVFAEAYLATQRKHDADMNEIGKVKPKWSFPWTTRRFTVDRHFA